MGLAVLGRVLGCPWAFLGGLGKIVAGLARTGLCGCKVGAFGQEGGAADPGLPGAIQGDSGRNLGGQEDWFAAAKRFWGM